MSDAIDLNKGDLERVDGPAGTLLVRRNALPPGGKRPQWLSDMRELNEIALIAGTMPGSLETAVDRLERVRQRYHEVLSRDGTRLSDPAFRVP